RVSAEGLRRTQAGRRGAAVEVELSRLWDGSEAPAGCGGSAGLELRAGRLELRWDLRLAAPPRMPQDPAGFTEGLWEWDVVELFLRSAAGRTGHYMELEFG